MRLGALLLCQAALRLPIQQLVLWDPVSSGAELLGELSAMQRRYLRGTAQLRCWRWPRARSKQRELLGMSYPEPASAELKALSLAPLLAQQRASVAWLTPPPLGLAERGPGEPDAGGTGYLDFDCGWRDVARIEDTIPDVSISERLARLVSEQQ